MKKIKAIINKYSLLLSLFLVIAIIGAGQFLNKKIKEEIRSSENEIKTKYEQVKKYEVAGEEAPSPQLIGRLSKEKGFLEQRIITLTENFSTEYPVSYEFKMYPAIEFKEYLYFSSDRLYKKASRRGLQMPSSLGFPTTGLVPASEINTLTLQFEAVKDVVNLIIDSGISVIEEITFGAPQKVDFYEVLPLKVTLVGTSNEILRCLKYFEQPSSYFVLKNFSITKTGRKFFRIDMGISGVILKLEKEEKI
jgi:hypothetical protein